MALIPAIRQFRWPERPSRLPEGEIALVWLESPAGEGSRQRQAGREALHLLLPALPAPYPSIRLEESPRGPIFVSEGKALPVGLSLSYSSELTLIGLFPGGRIGVDVSRVEDFPDWQDVAALYLHPSARERIASQPAHRQLHCFHEEWVRMEALAKCAGTGLTEWSPVRDEGGLAEAFRIVTPDAGHVAAIAVDRACP